MTEVAAPPAAPPETPPAAGPPATPPAIPASAAAAAFDATKYDSKDVSTWPAAAQAAMHDLREENATKRTKLTTAETTHQATLDAIAKALGLKGDDDPAKAAQTAADERDAAKTVAKNLAVENAVLRMAVKHGANPESLTDSRSFMRQLEAIDPAADDFATQVDAAIKAAVEANPSLKASPAAAERSGGHVGGSAPAQQSSDPQQRSRDYYAAQAVK